jgi:glycosyltransferase involved in cell wall biosynthesis
VVETVDQAVAACGRIDTLFRPSIRSRFEERFSVGAMAREYVKIYRQLARSGDVTAVAAE